MKSLGDFGQEVKEEFEEARVQKNYDLMLNLIEDMRSHGIAYKEVVEELEGSLTLIEREEMGYDDNT